MSTLKITAKDAHEFSAYCAKPQGAPRGGLIVIQEFFGVNGHIRRVCDQYAADGYFVLSPAIFDRVECDVELGYDEAGMNKGRELRARLDLTKCMADIQATIDAAASAGKVAALGYCWGGSLAYIASARLNGLACAIGYYGAQIAAHVDETPRVPVMLHYAEKDEYLPQCDIEKVRNAHPSVIIYQYPGTEHGFNCDDRRFYEPKSAAIARERTLSFLAKHVS
ncbi:MAG TPA: dienelactone hydrolase family protein [Pseudolabrys sp.]|jgi:carboxymethylenebutenolidase